MATNWHKIGQMPLFGKKIKWALLGQFSFSPYFGFFLSQEPLAPFKYEFLADPRIWNQKFFVLIFNFQRYSGPTYLISN